MGIIGNIYQGDTEVMSTSTVPRPAISPDWVYSPTSNVSVARDRYWFYTYTPFSSHVHFLPDNAAKPVVGTGTVCIAAKRPNRNGSEEHSSIFIYDVLHAPTLICNILGQGSFMDRYRFYRLENEPSVIERCRDIVVATFDDTKRPLCLRLSGPPLGPRTTTSRFPNSDGMFDINVQWPLAEREHYGVDVHLGPGSLTAC